MKKALGLLLVFTMFALMAVPVSARTCGRLRHRHSNVTHTHSACVGDGHKHGRSFWQKHRDKLTTAGGAGVGAIVGGIAGGGKGAAIGAAAGGGGAAVYTYGIRKRRRFGSLLRSPNFIRQRKRVLPVSSCEARFSLFGPLAPSPLIRLSYSK